MRKEGKDVAVEVICNGLLALQGNTVGLDRYKLIILFEMFFVSY